MSEDKSELHRLNRILDQLDHFQSEEEMQQARKGQRLTEKYRHLQPDYTEEDTEYF